MISLQAYLFLFGNMTGKVEGFLQGNKLTRPEVELLPLPQQNTLGQVASR